jgi:signal transduction histidine kinase
MAPQHGEARFRLAEQAADVGSWEWEIGTGVVHLSPVARRLLDIHAPGETCTYAEFRATIDSRDTVEVERAVQLRLTEGIAFRVEYRVRRPDGSVRWIHDVGDVVAQRDGRATVMAGAVHEFTDRKLHEEHLRRREQLVVEAALRQRRELHCTRQALIDTEVERARVQEALQDRDRAFEAIYSIATSFDSSPQNVLQQVVRSLAGILGTPYVEVVAAGQHGGYVSQARYESGEVSAEPVYCGECRLCRRIGEEKSPMQDMADRSDMPLEAVCMRRGYRSHLGVPVLSVDSSVLGVISVMDTRARSFSDRDVRLVEIFARYVAHETVRQRMELRLRSDERMKTLGQLTSGVAHEVRNPLSAIVSVLEALFDELRDRPDLSDYQVHLRKQVDKLSTLMEDLLTLGRGIGTADLLAVPASTLVSSAVSAWRDAHLRSGRELRLDIPHEAHGWEVRADITKVQQVFINLLDNAMQHSGDDSEVLVRVRSSDRDVSFDIVDRGRGIPPADLERVFDPFYTTRKGGTGLGLSIVQHIAASHGGRVQLHNNCDGPGVTARVVLPLA